MDYKRSTNVFKVGEIPELLNYTDKITNVSGLLNYTDKINNVSGLFKELNKGIEIILLTPHPHF